MFAKITKVLLLVVLAFSLSTINTTGVDAATNTVMWGKTELKLGQIGKATIIADATLVKLNTDGSLSNVRAMKKGEEYRVYSFKSNHGGLYGVGGGSFVQKNDKVKYETPSKSKMALLVEMANNPVATTPTPTTSVQEGLEVVKGAPSTYKNCTALKVYYPNGVMKGHSAYASKHDRDNDGWACEPSGR